MYFEEIVWNIQQQGEKKGSSLLLQRGENISEVASSEPNCVTITFGTVQLASFSIVDIC